MSVNTLDIGSKSGYPAGDLSNFTAFKFTLDEVECGSMEGFLQGLKFDKAPVQAEVCKLSGVKAKNRGKERNSQWKLKRTLWWKGEPIERQSEAYQRLLDRAYIALALQNEKFRQALEDTKDLILTHRIGKTSEVETVLTQSEFCNRLMRLRTLLRKGTKLESLKRL